MGALLKNKFEELIKFTEKEIVILSYINEYINFNIGYERRVFNEIEDLKSIKSDGILAILEFTIKFSNVDRELPKKLVKLLIEKND
ncbi:hypothetical protein COF34_28935 [Bacillus toyonensis]|uniref:hypothetical protein n=1 Tax=Bacillus toyonensis TaxID=155322 RepID=UPI000BED199C|nr:hypothetical protein [Bacillus toyonensis]RAN87293.1 hypothetical protein B5P41_24770 [Bacillus sp. SRB_28]PEC39832.1 hypothetical protein CON60_08710 [Bacillus toyonensis]PED58255.1 hypothetical protein CON89_27535 [Bacillus toyonensis]PEN40353.1 hypothetical protein CN541_09195 [Bacillus toyonensis]PEP63210.1 hypothetical protein CN574_17570 [Bacillus toyonensis]